MPLAGWTLPGIFIDLYLQHITQRSQKNESEHAGKSDGEEPGQQGVKRGWGE